MDISIFSYLWDGSEDGWVLLHVNFLENNEEPRYLIVNTETRLAKIIEDEDYFNAVVKKMLNSEVDVVSVGNGF